MLGQRRSAAGDAGGSLGEGSPTSLFLGFRLARSRWQAGFKLKNVYVPPQQSAVSHANLSK